MTLKALRARAARIGIRIDTERYDVALARSPWGYWLVDEKTGEGPWPDENYCADHGELTTALRTLEAERT